MFTYEQYKESAEYVKGKLAGRTPEFLVVLGSGLGNLAQMVDNPIYIPYSDVPYFVVSTAIGHVGRFVAGNIGGKLVLMMQGRFHMYEGWTAEQVAYPIRVAKLVGINNLIITNAAGGVNREFGPGDLMLIDDFIRLCIENPLIGQNIPEFGERFCDMTYTFDKEYQRLFEQIAIENGVSLRHGVYYFASGPMYETPAEIRAMRLLGADAVGMSTVHECIAANHCSMRILGISLITNMAAGVLDCRLSGEEVIEAGNRASGKLSRMVYDFICKA